VFIGCAAASAAQHPLPRHERGRAASRSRLGMPGAASGARTFTANHEEPHL